MRPFAPPGAPPAGGQWQVSTAGGIHPVWRSGRQGAVLHRSGWCARGRADRVQRQPRFYLARQWCGFSTRILGGGIDAGQGRQYDIAPDGRFLINTVIDDVDAPITLLQHWRPEDTVTARSSDSGAGAWAWCPDPDALIPDRPDP